MAARMLLVLDPTGNEKTAFKIVRKTWLSGQPQQVFIYIDI